MKQIGAAMQLCINVFTYRQMPIYQLEQSMANNGPCMCDIQCEFYTIFKTHVDIYIYIYVCMCICIYVYKYTYIYIYAYASIQ